MKTEPKCNPNPKPIHPRFFKKFCEKCKMDFVKEWGWKYTEIFFEDKSIKYICKECAPTQKDAYYYFRPEKKKFIITSTWKQIHDEKI